MLLRKDCTANPEIVIVRSVFMAMILALACNSPGRSMRLASDSALTVELIERGRADQAVRQTLIAKMQQGATPDSAEQRAMLATDSANTEWLKEVIRTHGWPGRTRFGEEAAGAAFLILQHAPDTAFQRSTLDLLQNEVDKRDVDGQELALLVDRVSVQSGRPQVYGTQAGIVDGEVVLKPIIDSSRVDERRAALGLMPLGAYVDFLDSLYTGGNRRERE